MTTIQRRRVLGILGGIAAAPLAARLATVVNAAPEPSGLKLTISASPDGDGTQYTIMVENPAGPDVRQVTLMGSVPAGATGDGATTTPKGTVFQGFQGADPQAAAVWTLTAVTTGASVGPFVYRVRGSGAARASAHWALPTPGNALSGETGPKKVPGPGAAIIQAPALPGAPAISPRDRLYSADQTSNTVTIINPATETVLGQIALGNPRPDDVLAATYFQEVDVHGLGFSPDGKLLNVVDVTTNSVAIIETATNTVLGKVYVGRAPHEGAFTPDGTQLWVAVRGEDYVSVIDPYRLKEIRQIKTLLGASKVNFRPDGAVAFVNSIRVPEVAVVDTGTYEVVTRIPVVSRFASDGLVSPDGKEFWLGHKDIGVVSQIDAQAFRVMHVFETGDTTNHANFVSTAVGDFAYITVGGENVVRVFSRGPDARLVTSIPTGDVPHGIWPSPDNTRVYVVLEDGDAMQVIDTATNTVTKTLPIGQMPQALVYVAGAVPEGDGTQGLIKQRIGFPVKKAKLVVPDKPVAFLPDALGKKVKGSALARSLGNVDELTINADGLPPNARYAVFLSELPAAPYGAVEYIADFAVDGTGKGMVTAQVKVFDAVAGNGQDATSGKRLGHVLIVPRDPATIASLFTDRGQPVASTDFGPDGPMGPVVLTTSNDPAASSPFGTT